MDSQQENNIDLNVGHVFINNDDELLKQTKMSETHSNTQSETATVSHSR